MSVTAHNLRTGDECLYAHDDARAAVVSCWMIEHGMGGDVANEDKRASVPVLVGKHSVFAGDWAARLRADRHQLNNALPRAPAARAVGALSFPRRETAWH